MLVSSEYRLNDLDDHGGPQAIVVLALVPSLDK